MKPELKYSLYFVGCVVFEAYFHGLQKSVGTLAIHAGLIYALFKKSK